jgi:hypothetical protein
MKTQEHLQPDLLQLNLILITSCLAAAWYGLNEISDPFRVLLHDTFFHFEEWIKGSSAFP